MTSATSRATLTLALLLSWGSFGYVQAPREQTLPRATVESAEPFTRINAIRELQDGRVLVVDAGDAVVRLVDFQRGTAIQVGRQGGGPGEYKFPYRLLSLSGDSTLLTDPLQGRSIVIGPGGVAGDALLTPGGLGRTLPAARTPTAADARGRFYSQASDNRPPSTTELPDSAALYRVDPASGKVDTITNLKLPWSKIEIGRLPDGRIKQVSVFHIPFMAQDDWVVLPDGRVAVIRVGDYHLELIGPDRSVTRGPRIPYVPVAVTDAERKRVTQGVLPKFKPPFDGASTLLAPDNRLWIKRTTAEGDSAARYDVIDLAGKLLARVSLPLRTRIVGFGSSVVYLVRKDEDDLEHLGRLPLPRF